MALTECPFYSHLFFSLQILHNLIMHAPTLLICPSKMSNLSGNRSFINSKHVFSVCSLATITNINTFLVFLCESSYGIMMKVFTKLYKNIRPICQRGDGFKFQILLFSTARVDQIVGKGSKAEGDTDEDPSMMGRLGKVEKQVSFSPSCWITPSTEVKSLD